MNFDCRPGAGNGIALRWTTLLRGGCVSSRPSPNWANRARLLLLGVVSALALVHPQRGMGQEQLTRKVRTKVAPVYPDVARRMHLTGTVRLVVVVTPSGKVKTAKLVGGHPILVSAAMDALKRWKFEPGSEESTGIVEFKFQPSD